MLFYWVVFIAMFSFLDWFFSNYIFNQTLWMKALFFFFFFESEARGGTSSRTTNYLLFSIIAELKFVLYIILPFCVCHNDTQIIQQKSMSLWKLLFSLCRVFKSSCQCAAASCFNKAQMRNRVLEQLWFSTVSVFLLSPGLPFHSGWVTWPVYTVSFTCAHSHLVALLLPEILKSRNTWTAEI